MIKSFQFYVGALLLAFSIEVLAVDMAVEIDDSLSELIVTVEAGSGPLRIRSSWLRENVVPLENLERSRRRLTPIDSTRASTYKIDLRHNGQQWAIARWHRPLRFSDWHDWLATPIGWSMRRPIDLQIELAADSSVMLPFQLVSKEGAITRYRAYPILSALGGLTVFGNIESIEYRDMTLSIVGDDNDQYETWAKKVIDLVAELHAGSPPMSHLVIVPIPFISGVVPWAHVRRGGASHIIAYVREGVDTDALAKDWTLYHEMMHLYHPYLGDRGRWVSEGFASYFQNVYRAQAGVVTPEHGWERLQAGLERGRKENAERGFRPVSEGGRMRTYWTAAALALAADIEIRQRTQGETTLADVIGRFARRSLPASRTWHPREYMVALDKELNQEVLTSLYDEIAFDEEFPKVEVTDGQWQQIFTRK